MTDRQAKTSTIVTLRLLLKWQILAWRRLANRLILEKFGYY